MRRQDKHICSLQTKTPTPSPTPPPPLKDRSCSRVRKHTMEDGWIERADSAARHMGHSRFRSKALRRHASPKLCWFGHCQLTRKAKEKKDQKIRGRGPKQPWRAGVRVWVRVRVWQRRVFFESETKLRALWCTESNSRERGSS